MIETIIPGFATRDGQPWLAFGVMGGDMQPQGQAQIIINMVDYGLDLQAAGDSPRWHHEGSSEPTGEAQQGVGLLRVETGIPDATKKQLAALGWKLGPPDGGFVAGPHAGQELAVHQEGGLAVGLALLDAGEAERDLFEFFVRHRQ